ncbi:orotidine-5-phosphate decarboxylase [Phaffia rhodozyma]|uniref:Orotidine 5'-phosphate decarboxylase n=1 Tax=Phaffia rhodozyma TaxID=264483 RepID=A0A0F7SM16_PHARH|nr:orotidine-5-phosphate decarboxylase [Phaffia rhodozyma]
MVAHPSRTRTYEERLPLHVNQAAKDLLETMIRKQSNLCVSVDVTTKEELLAIVEAVGASSCAIKTHCDIISDFDDDLVDRLTELSKKLDFQIFEDRKFADIGNTVSLQYSSGLHRIASWSHLTNAHALPGPGIVTGLSAVGLPLNRGLLLLAQMSSVGMLANESYSRETVRMAAAHRDFVVGFIAQSRVEELLSTESAEERDAVEKGDFLILSPGVGLGVKSDGKGQQYRTPDQVIGESGCDVIIVGRGIYKGAGKDEWKSEAERYKVAGWKAYEDRVRR